NLDAVGIENLKPIVEMAIGQVSQRGRVRGHPFIDQQWQSGRGVVVGSARCGEVEDLPPTGLAVGIRAVGTVGRESGIVHVIENGRLRIERKDQREGTRAGWNTERSVGRTR